MDGRPFVDPSGLLASWRREYLDTALPGGVSAVKWLSGREGSGKTYFLERLRDEARAAGFLTASVDAGRSRLGRFDEVYGDVAGQIVPAIGPLAAESAARRLGVDDWRAGSHPPLLDVLVQRGRPDAAVRADLRTAFDFLYEDRDVSEAVANVVRTLAAPYLHETPQASVEADTVAAWARGERVAPQELRHLGIRRRIDRVEAREVFRGLLFALVACGVPGVVLTVDRLEAVTGRGDGVAYRRSGRDDAYESLREFVDEAGSVPGLFLVAAGRPEVFEDGRRGVPSYPALAMRVVNEIQDGRGRPNPRNDLQSLDELWRHRWPEHRDALCRAYGADPARLEEPPLWTTPVSPVKVLLEALARQDGGIGRGP